MKHPAKKREMTLINNRLPYMTLEERIHYLFPELFEEEDENEEEDE